MKQSQAAMAQASVRARIEIASSASLLAMTAEHESDDG